MRLWTAQKIAFWAKYESSGHPGDWSPHLMPLLSSSSTDTPNCEDIYRFGLVLLELAGISSDALLKRDGLENSSISRETLERMERLVRLESDNLTGLVGKPYKMAVQRCFKICFDLARGSDGCIPEDSMT
jgi:hypothetical protein